MSKIHHIRRIWKDTHYISYTLRGTRSEAIWEKFLQKKKSTWIHVTTSFDLAAKKTKNIKNCFESKTSFKVLWMHEKHPRWRICIGNISSYSKLRGSKNPEINFFFLSATRNYKSKSQNLTKICLAQCNQFFDFDDFSGILQPIPDRWRNIYMSWMISNTQITWDIEKYLRKNIQVTSKSTSSVV